MSKSKKKSFGSRLWDFLSGQTREPTTWDVVSSLKKGSEARAKVNALYKEQEKIENRRKQINDLTAIIYSTPETSAYHQEAFEKLKRILKR